MLKLANDREVFTCFGAPFLPSARAESGAAILQRRRGNWCEAVRAIVAMPRE
jgi:hypothetical protein